MARAVSTQFFSPTRFRLRYSRIRNFHSVQAFHATKSSTLSKGNICPRDNKDAFAKSLKASGVEIDEAESDIPSVLQEIPETLKPVQSNQSSYGKPNIAGLLRGFATEGNESTFTHAIFPHLLPTINQILDADRMPRSRDHVVLGGPWGSHPPLDPDVRPALSLPKTGILLGFRESVFNRYGQAKEELSNHMRPVGAGLSFPYYSLEAESCKGDPEVAVLQNAHATALMLRNLWILITKAQQRNEKHPRLRDAEGLVVLSSVLTPTYCTLDCHWLSPSDHRLRFYRRQVRKWTFPDHFEDASQGLISAIDWAHQNLERTLDRNLENFERDLGRKAQRESGTSAADYGMYDVAFPTQGANSYNGTIVVAGQEP